MKSQKLFLGEKRLERGARTTSLLRPNHFSYHDYFTGDDVPEEGEEEVKMRNRHCNFQLRKGGEVI